MPGQFFSVLVGVSGAWHEMPVGAYIPGLKPRRRTNYVQVPLMPGAINIADREYEPLTVPLTIEFYEDTARALSDAIAAVRVILEDHEGDTIMVRDDIVGDTVVFAVTYDELNEPGIVYRNYTKMKVATVTFPLVCTTDPSISILGFA